MRSSQGVGCRALRASTQLARSVAAPADRAHASRVHCQRMGEAEPKISIMQGPGLAILPQGPSAGPKRPAMNANAPAPPKVQESKAKNKTTKAFSVGFR